MTTANALLEEDIDTSYEPFSREPQYIGANRTFIATLGMRPDMAVLDLACGTATMTDLILENVFGLAGREHGPQSGIVDGDGFHVLGVDLSRESLLLGREHLAELGTVGRDHRAGPRVLDLVHLVEGSADRVPVVDDVMDLVIMGNAIQLVPDRESMFSEIRRVLHVGGRFAFNTSFYAGTYCKGTEHVYLRWVQEASLYLAKRSAELVAAGKPGIKRQRGRAARAFSNPWLSSDQYASELREHGFEVEYLNQRTVMLDQRCFETIGAYAGLARVLLSGYPVKLASEALEKASGPTLEAVGMSEVPRYWLEMVVRRAR
jgi:ubiquinone/menaquinone biosynthesis C-methylase UbiE